MGITENYLNQLLPDVSTSADDITVGIAGFTALVRLSDSVELTADAPDIPLEDGSIVHDHVINQPRQIKIEGEVGNLFITQSNLSSAIDRIIPDVGLITQYLNPQTQSEIQRIAGFGLSVIDATNKIDEAINSSKKIIDIFNNEGATAKTKSVLFYEQINKIYNSKSLITISTPWGNLDNMLLTSISFQKENDSDEYLKFTLQAKQLTFVKTEVAAISENFSNPSPSLGGQTEGTKEKAKNQGEKVGRSAIKSILDLF